MTNASWFPLLALAGGDPVAEQIGVSCAYGCAVATLALIDAEPLRSDMRRMANEGALRMAFCRAWDPTFIYPRDRSRGAKWTS